MELIVVSRHISSGLGVTFQIRQNVICKFTSNVELIQSKIQSPNVTYVTHINTSRAVEEKYVRVPHLAIISY